MLDTLKALRLLDGVCLFVTAGFELCLHHLTKFTATNLLQNGKVAVETPNLVLG